MHPKRISILGVGLLGGSIGLAVKSHISGCSVFGYGHRRSTLQTALEIGAVDQATMDLAEAVHEANLVILCTPVGIFGRLVEEMVPALTSGTIVTDVGSTKRSIVRMAGKALPRGVHFVGSHPMAGSEKRGVEFARTDLFQNALCILTPTAATNVSALRQVEGFWKAIGMRTARLSPQAHDRLLADISHLPHAVAAALVAMQKEAGLRLAGKGFLDTTRVAGGDGGLWRDILMDNRDNLKASIAHLREQLEHLEKLLDRKNTEELARWLQETATRREELHKKKLEEIEE